MSADFIARLIGMIVFSILGVYLGTYLGRMANLNPGDFPFTTEQYAFTIGLVGALTGLILTPIITTRPIRAFRSLLTRISPQSLFCFLARVDCWPDCRRFAGFPALAAALAIWSSHAVYWCACVRVYGYFGIRDAAE